MRVPGKFRVQRRNIVHSHNGPSLEFDYSCSLVGLVTVLYVIPSFGVEDGSPTVQLLNTKILCSATGKPTLANN